MQTFTAIGDGSLRGTKVLITGGTSGLGRSMAQALTDAGADTAIAGRDGERAAQVAAELGGTTLGIEMDVRDETSIEEGTAEVYSRLGGLDLLVNNAGVGMRTVHPRFLDEPQGFWEVSPEGYRNVVDTKLNGTFLVARAVVPRMLAAKSGRIVMISMSTETMTRRGFVPYGPAGAGVEALARVMAADLRETGVTVNILLPGGPTATGMVPDDVPDTMRERLLDPDIMAKPIVWLASPEAAGVHDERIVATEFEDWLEMPRR